MASKTCNWLIVGAAAVAAVLGAGCARGARRAENRGFFRLRTPEVKLLPTESRVDTVLGTVLVMPVAVEGPIPGDKTIAARMDDGRKVDAKLCWVSVLPDGPAGGWLPSAGRWIVTPASAGSRPSAAGSWVVVAELPMDAAGQGFTIAGHRVPLNWLVDPGLIRPRQGEGPWRPPLGDALPPTLLKMVESDAASPVRRWRYRLLTRGLEPEHARSGAGELPRLDDPVLEALAHQTEARWQVALATLWMADAELAERVKRRLAATVDAGGGIVAPAWPTDQASLDALLADLLSQRLEPMQKAERAAVWLDAQPSGAAWVVDDAGLRDASTGRALATCGVANLLERTTLAWADAGGTQGAPELTTLEAFSLGQVAAAAPAEGTARPVPVEVHAGRWSATRLLALGRAPALPPGVRVDGLFGDWNMGAWLSGVPDEAMLGEVAWAGAALLCKGAADGSGSWWVYVESRSPGMMPGEESGAGPRETVRVWLGPLAHPAAVLRASSSGVVVDEAAVDQGLEAMRPARVSRGQDSWVVQVPIPQRCIEQDGTIRIAIERTDSRGRRSTWPRPMLPWQSEPGRIAVDTTAWGDASAAK